MGFPPSSRRQLQSPHADGHPRSVFVPPSTFRTSSTGSSSAGLASLFRLAAVSRVLAPGDCSPDQFVPARRRPFPSRRWRRRLPVSRRQQTSRRPQGVAPDRDPTCPRGGLDPRVTRIPSCVFSSLGSVSRDLAGAITPAPLTTFSVRRYVCPARSVPSVSISLQPVALSPERLPVRASSPALGIAPSREARRWCERSGVAADRADIEHPACQPQTTHNPTRSKFRIALNNVGGGDRGVDNLSSDCAALTPERRTINELLVRCRRERHVCRERADARVIFAGGIVRAPAAHVARGRAIEEAASPCAQRPRPCCSPR